MALMARCVCQVEVCVCVCVLRGKFSFLRQVLAVFSSLAASRPSSLRIEVAIAEEAEGGTEETWD